MHNTTVKYLIGDTREQVATIADGTVSLVATSPHRHRRTEPRALPATTRRMPTQPLRHHTRNAGTGGAVVRGRRCGRASRATTTMAEVDANCVVSVKGRSPNRLERPGLLITGNLYGGSTHD